jgi:glycine cleavage system H protein
MTEREEYSIPEGFYYTKDHEWVRRKTGESDVVLVGITDYAAKMLHDIVYVTLPQEGQILSQKEVLGQVESVKTVADVYMPVSGSILKTNQELTLKPELISESPYESGWMVEVKASNLDNELKSLLSRNQYSEYVNQLKASEEEA